MTELAEMARKLSEALERQETEAAPAWQQKRYRRCRRWHSRWHGEVDWSGSHPRLRCDRCEVWWVW